MCTHTHECTDTSAIKGPVSYCWRCLLDTTVPIVIKVQPRRLRSKGVPPTAPHCARGAGTQGCARGAVFWVCPPKSVCVIVLEDVRSMCCVGGRSHVLTRMESFVA